MNIQNEIATAGANEAAPPPARILIFRRGSIGDAIVSIPALNYIRNKNAGAELICLSNSPVMEAASPVKSVRPLCLPANAPFRLETFEGRLTGQNDGMVLVVYVRHAVCHGSGRCLPE